LSQILRQSSDKIVPSEEPSETSSQSEPQKEQPEQPGDGKMMKDMSVAGAIALGLPFVVKSFRKMFFKKDDDVPVTNMADQRGSQFMDPSSSNSVIMSRNELMMSSAAQESSRYGASHVQYVVQSENVWVSVSSFVNSHTHFSSAIHHIRNTSQ
jgi:hypothetical protein